jgi:hypothetical protein
MLLSLQTSQHLTIHRIQFKIHCTFEESQIISQLRLTCKHIITYFHTIKYWRYNHHIRCEGHCGGDIPTNTRLLLIYTFIGTFCKYTTCICGAWSGALDVTDGRLIAAPIAGYVATYRTCRANTRTAMLELYVLIGLRHFRYWLADWLRRLLNCLEANPSENAARNNTRIVAIVGYHRNPLYRAVAWIPICISVIWSSKFLTCGRFPWEAPTTSLQSFRRPVCVSVTIISDSENTSLQASRRTNRLVWRKYC